MPLGPTIKISCFPNMVLEPRFRSPDAATRPCDPLFFFLDRSVFLWIDLVFHGTTTPAICIDGGYLSDRDHRLVCARLEAPPGRLRSTCRPARTAPAACVLLSCSCRLLSAHVCLQLDLILANAAASCRPRVPLLAGCCSAPARPSACCCCSAALCCSTQLMRSASLLAS